MTHDSSRPRMGQDVYVPSESYLNHGRDDFAGGLCHIVEVNDELLAGQLVPFVEFEERPGYLYNWHWLMELQDELRARYGDQRGHPDPDLRPEFNRDWNDE